MERRKHTRVSVEVEVDITSDSNFFGGTTRDMSAGGLFIETTSGIDIGAAITIQLTLDGKTHALPAEVMWALDRADGETFGIGVQFISLPPSSRNAIIAFMKQRAPLEFEMFDPEPEDGVDPSGG